VLWDRVKVDNEIKIFRANGTLACSLSFAELYEVHWRAFPKGTFKKGSL